MQLYALLGRCLNGTVTQSAALEATHCTSSSNDQIKSPWHGQNCAGLAFPTAHLRKLTRALTPPCHWWRVCRKNWLTLLGQVHRLDFHLAPLQVKTLQAQVRVELGFCGLVEWPAHSG